MSEPTQARQLVVFTLADEQYALPITQVQEIIRYRQPRSIASSEPWIRGVLNLRGRIVPVYDLAARLGAGCRSDEQAKIVILDTGTATVGVVVDAVDEVLTIDDAQLEDAPGSDRSLVDGIAKLQDRLVLLLSPATVFGSAGLAA